MIRQYQNVDFEQIITIYNTTKLNRSRLDNPQYVSRIQRDGFLLGVDNSAEIKSEIDGSLQTLVYEDNSKILGFIIADHSKKQQYIDDEYKTWFDTGLKTAYYQDTVSMTLATVAVDPNSLQKGIASQLLDSLEIFLREKKYKYLFSIICMSPLTNCASIVWHSKQGFKRLAMSRPRPQLLNLEWYSSVLFYKKI